MKKIGALLCSAMLVAALPTMAFADTSGASPENHSLARNGGTTMTVEGGSNINVEAISQNASNYVAAKAGDALVTSFEITGDATSGVSIHVYVGTQYAGMIARVYIQHNDGSTEQQSATVASDGTINFTMNRLSTVTVAIANGQSAAATSQTTNTANSANTANTANSANAANAASGSTASEATAGGKLLEGTPDEATAVKATKVTTTKTTKTASSTDKSASSPKTGVDFAGVAGGTAILAISAGGVAVAYRKKARE